MEAQLKELLEKLEEVYPKSIKYSELLERYPNHLIFGAYDGGLIEKDDESHQKDPQFDDYYRIGVQGVELLNQIRTRDAVNKLNATTTEFNESSGRISGVMIAFTFALVVMTIIQVAKTLGFEKYLLYILIASVFGIGILAFYFRKRPVMQQTP